MKHVILGILALSSVSAFSQTVSPSEVCQAISRFSGQSGAECAQAISRGRFDYTVNDVALAVANSGSYSSATKIMVSSANRYLDDDIARACKAIARFSGQSAADCVANALDNAYTPELASVAETIANNGSYSSAVAAVKNAANGWSVPGAADVCKSIARFSGQSAADCVSAIINKNYFNGAESVCLTLANQGSYSSAVTCMRNSGIATNERPRRRNRDGWNPNPNPGQYNPNPRPDYGSVRVSNNDLEDISKNIKKARRQYERGNYTQMEATLIDLDRKLDEIKATAR